MTTERHYGKRGKNAYAMWLGFMEQTRGATANEEMLAEYFLREFGQHPHILPQFLTFLSASIKTGGQRAKKIAACYLSVLSPLCERLGLFDRKSVMDAFCFQVIDPVAYRKTDDLLQKYKRTSQRSVRRITAALQDILAQKKCPGVVKGRYKNVYSIHRKLIEKKYAGVLALQDIFAFRIILSDNDEKRCFDVLNILHDYFRPRIDRFKNYITIPKVNGYQSLHTVLTGVLPDLDLPVEVQIRSKIMDEFAERGLASHWVYAKNKHMRILGEKERKLVEHFQSFSEEDRGESVYCFTPKGDILKLPKGSTVLHFAYRIHSAIGAVAAHARVNGSLQKLSYELQDGDSIDIVKSARRRAHSSHRSPPLHAHA